MESIQHLGRVIKAEDCLIIKKEENVSHPVSEKGRNWKHAALLLASSSWRFPHPLSLRLPHLPLSSFSRILGSQNLF